jgi:hypothetical protein
MFDRANALCRAVNTLAFAGRAIELHQHGVVDIATERVLNGFQICLVAVAGQLNPG